MAWRQLATELLATFALVFFCCGSVLANPSKTITEDSIDADTEQRYDRPQHGSAGRTGHRWQLSIRTGIGYDDSVLTRPSDVRAGELSSQPPGLPPGDPPPGGPPPNNPPPGNRPPPPGPPPSDTAASDHLLDTEVKLRHTLHWPPAADSLFPSAWFSELKMESKRYADITDANETKLKLYSGPRWSNRFGHSVVEIRAEHLAIDNDRFSNEYGVLLQHLWSVSGRWHAGLKGLWVEQQFAQSRDAALFDGTKLEAAVVTRVRLSTDSQLKLSLGHRQLRAEADQVSYDSLVFEAAFNTRMSNDVRLSLRYKQRNVDYRGVEPGTTTERRDRRREWQLDVAKSLTRSLDLGLRYKRNDDDSNIDRFGLDRDRLTLYLRYQL